MRSLKASLLVAAALAPAANADVFLGRAIFDRDIGILGMYPTMTHSVYLSPLSGVFTGEGTLFEDIVLMDGDMRIDTVTLADDPDFARHAELLTDGLDWFYYDRFQHNGVDVIAAYGPESFRVPRPALPGPDLHGWTITRIVRLTEVHIAVPGSDPNGDGNWTEFQIRAETRFYGIPAPATLSAFALVALTRRRR